MRRHLARTPFLSFKSHPGCLWCDSGAGPRRAALRGDHLPVHRCRRACAEAEPTRRLHGLDAADLPAICGRTGGDATRSHVQSVHVRAALPGIFRLFGLSMSSAGADDMAWGWLLEMPPMRYSDSNAKIAIFLSHSAARNGACDALHDREGRVRAGDPLRYPHPAKPCRLGPSSPAEGKGVERSEAGEGLSAAEDRFCLFFPCSIRLVGKRSRI
jgi:hypothetical protein